MKARLFIPAEKAALLCIDLQEEHRQDERYLVEGFGDVLERVSRLQETARERRVPVLHAAFVVDAEEVPASRPLHPRGPDGKSAFSDRHDPRTEICAEVAPKGGEPVFFKSEASAFGNRKLKAHLEELGIQWLLIAGVWTEACVDLTVRQAVDFGFRVLLVKDACGSGTLTMHQVAILNLANRLYGGAVVDCQDACALLSGQGVDAWQTPRPVPLRFRAETINELYEGV